MTYFFFARFLQITTATIASITARHPATIVMIPTVVLKKGIGGGTVGLVAFTERILNTWLKSSLFSSSIVQFSLQQFRIKPENFKESCAPRLAAVSYFSRLNVFPLLASAKVFLRLAPVTYFRAPCTSHMFSRTWHMLNVFPHLA